MKQFKTAILGLKTKIWRSTSPARTMNSQLGGMKECPGCSKDLKGHRYACLSSVIEGTSEHTGEFFENIENRRWKKLLNTKEWDGGADILFLYAIKCPNGGIPTVLVRSPFELSYDDHVLAIEVLNLMESQTLIDIGTKLNWKPLPSL